MIFVTLGTHPQPMDRLIRALDDLVERGTIIDDILIQAAALRVHPRHATVEGIREFDWVKSQIEQAEVIISHAGPGTLATIRTAGRMPIVVPRSAAAGEHVDDHQIAYARRLMAQPGYIVVLDLVNLPMAIERARQGRAEALPADVSRAIAALERLLGTDL